jgi:hypothetical protein
MNPSFSRRGIFRQSVPALLAAASWFPLAPLGAQTPTLLNYQGRVAVNSMNFEGSGMFRFALVNPAGDTTFWSNDGTSAAGSEPTGAVSLPVAKGLYSVMLGDTAIANMTAIAPAVFANPDVRLRVWFDDGVNASQLLAPDQRIAPAPYLADGAVTDAAIAPGAVTGASIAAGAVGGTQIAAGSLNYNHFVVPAAPQPGQVLGFDGNGLSWGPGGGGGSVWTLNGSNAYYNSGKVGIGTSTPASKLTIYTLNQPAFGSTIGFEHDSQSVRLCTTVNNDDGGGLGTFTNHNLGLFANSRTPGVTILASGGVKIDGGGGRNVIVGSPNGETGMTMQYPGESNRADIRFDGTILKLLAATAAGPPSANNGITINAASGNVGIGGSPTPVAKLEVVGQDALRLIGYQPFLSLLDSNSGYASSRIQGVAGNLTFETESFINGSNPNNFAQLSAAGIFSVKALTIRGGADLAEPFPMSHGGITPGTVVSIDPAHPGQLQTSTVAYDRKVAGIVSGANGIQAGISMIDEAQLAPGENVALSGRVYVRANASAGEITPGDLLTTSDIPGEAMKAADHDRAQGSILGKAMTPLDATTGTVLVLVTLQ